MKKNEDLWSILQFNHRKRLCPFCGQVVEGMATMCDMCEKHMYAGVLSTCRALLISSKRDLSLFSPKKDKEKKKTEEDIADPGVQEVAVSRVLNQFPHELAKRTKQFRKSLHTEGVWFAHVCAWWMIRSIRDVDSAPQETVGEPMYKEIRDLVYTYLEKGNRALSEEQMETIQNVYSLDGSEGSARRVIAYMINLLEEEGKIQINRPAEKGMENEDRLESRRAISQMLFKTGTKSTPSAPSSTPRGMHTRER